MLSLYIGITIIGLLFWSFATVLVTRWHTHEEWILFWRSKCPKCHHTLSWFELLPLISYIFLLWKCRKCSTKIPLFYPLAEIIMASIFLILTISYIRIEWYFVGTQYALLLMLWFITGVYVLSDIRYMEIPDEILVPWIYWYLLLLWIGYYNDSLGGIFFDVSSYIWGYKEFIFDHLFGAFVLYTFLFLQIIIPATIQYAKKKKWSDVGWVFLSYFTFPILLLFPQKESTKNDDETSIETWVWWWDLRVALFIWITLGLVHGIFSFFVAYILWSFIWIIIILFTWKVKSQIPFWPFLAFWWLMAIYFHSDILSLLEAYKTLL